jgi:aspartyl-tRNA(Asn)/glutamyl-tRNA(Gln) amidotransferase subunit A
VGFKPTQRRIPLGGTFPLSSSLDSIGPIARTVADCRIIDEVLSGRTIGESSDADIRSLRLLVPEDYVLNALDDHVSRYFERALSHLSSAGVSIQYAPLPELSTIPQLHATGTFPGYEGYALHRSRLEASGNLYDPRVRSRLQAASQWTAENYDNLKRGRLALMQSVNAATRSFDALLMPTVPIIAPPISAFDDEDTFHRINLLLLRNPTVVNLLDGCAITVPCHRAGDAPVGLMIVGKSGSDDLILSIGQQIEQILSAIRN